MKNIWFITNPNSGTATPAKCEALEETFRDEGLSLRGRTDFPVQDIPTARELDDAGVDTLLLYAGDGTVNSALKSLDAWNGQFLILPGGTMNLLAKELHDTLDPQAIVAAAVANPRLTSLSYIDAGEERSYVGLILGPAATWGRAREAARKGRFGRMFGAIRAAWRNTFHRRGIRISGAPSLGEKYQAVFVFPHEGKLDVSAIDAREWQAIVKLGWDWVTGSWVEAQSVTNVHTKQLQVIGNKPAVALFDGEPVNLDPSVKIVPARTAKRFLRTKTE